MTRRKRRVAIVACVVAVTGCGGGGDDGAIAENSVALDEWTITGDLEVPAETQLTVKNTGTIRHNLVVGDAQTTVILAGDSGALALDGLPPGTYEAWCSLPHHRAEGMTTQLVITAPASTGAT
ncbi:MAG: hypothetical protein SGJ13_12595 [Actinomycetota bacterium]|nr:hypothetical protein [Actinomycetota bacterium]